MKIAVIADLHLAPPGVETFGHRDEAFAKCLKFLEEGHDLIILLGDIIDALTSSIPGDHTEAFWSAWNRYPLTTQRFKQGIKEGTYIYVRGNHDLVAKAEVGAIDKFSIHDNKDQKWTFVHGHEQDIFWSARFGEVFSWLGGWTHRLGIGLIQRGILWGETKRHVIDSKLFFHNIAQFALKTNSTFVVTGHTHVQGVKQVGSAHHINPGACVFGKWRYLSIDLNTGDYHTIG